MQESTRLEIVPATAEDAKVFFNGLPPYRLRAYAGRIDGRTIGIGGIYFLPSGLKAAFLVLSPEGKNYPVALCKAAKAFLKKLRDEGVRKIIAVADPGIPSAERFLLHFGFTPQGIANNQVIYEWLPPTTSTN